MKSTDFRVGLLAAAAFGVGWLPAVVVEPFDSTAGWAGWCAAAEGPVAEKDLFKLRPKDEVYLKNGTVKRGRVLKLTTRLRFKDEKDRIFEVPLYEVREVKRATTPASELKRLSLQYAGNPVMIERIVREALRRFPALKPAVADVLELECAGRDPTLLRLAGGLCCKLGRFKAAEEKARLLVKLQGRPEDRLLLGRALVARDQLDEAEKVLREAWRGASKNEEIGLAYANLSARRGDWKTARQVYAAVLEAHPDSAGAHVGLGEVALREGKLAAAAKSFSVALRISPELGRARLGSASCLLLTKQYAEADKLADRILAGDKENAEALAVKGWVRLFSGGPDAPAAAVKYFEAGLKKRGDRPRLWLACATALERAAFYEAAAGRGDAAAAARKQAEELRKKIEQADPADAYLQYWLGKRRFGKGDWKGAERAFRRVAVLAPKYAPVFGALGATALRQRAWAAAAAAYGKAAALDGETAEWHAGLGIALLGLKRISQARAELSRALGADAGHAEALCALGYLANHEKNEAAARTFFQRALAADGDCRYAAEALRRLAAQRGVDFQYHTFAGGKLPEGWRARGPLRPTVSAGGEAVWSGVPSGRDFTKYCMLTTRVRGNNFRRLAADLRVASDAPVECGLRLSAGGKGRGGYEVAFGKNAAGELVYRVQGPAGRSAEWKSCRGKRWPADGRARLTLETDDLATGKVRLYFNGELLGLLPTKLKAPSRLSVAVFLYLPTKQAVEVRADNLVLVAERPPEEEGREGEGKEGGELIPPEKLKKPKKKPAPPKPKEKKDEGSVLLLP